MQGFKTLNVMLSKIQLELGNSSTGSDKTQIQPNSIYLKECGHMII